MPLSRTLFPGRERLCEASGLTAVSVRRNLAILIEHGFVQRVSHGVSRGHDGRPRRSHYRLLVPARCIEGLSEPLSPEPLKVLSPSDADAQVISLPTRERSPFRGEAPNRRTPAEITCLPEPLSAPSRRDLQVAYQHAAKAFDELWLEHEFEPWSDRVSADMEYRRLALTNAINRLGAFDALRASKHSDGEASL